MDNLYQNDATPQPRRNMNLSWESKWQLYVLFMRSFLAWLEKHFENLGRRVTSYPKTTILISLIGVAICSAGLTRLNFESRSSKFLYSLIWYS